ncbi:hypothetical protein JOB18_016963 [Solea senegalensis]|uniref:Uncharacterized protein n=1 Tax=Solea senegalensis TaxID=28829 RepID=A0AAV6QW95_SOLSE|nr:hypothetical protein JOB18_016963 [Solea senegalensis]
MSLNTSSNITVPSSLACKSNSSAYPPIFMCFDNQVSSAIYTAFSTVTILFVLPMCGAVIWKGFCRWRFTGMASKTSSQSDIFVFYMVTTEFVGIMANGSRIKIQDYQWQTELKTLPRKQDVLSKTVVVKDSHQDGGTMDMKGRLTDVGSLTLWTDSEVLVTLGCLPVEINKSFGREGTGEF